MAIFPQRSVETKRRSKEKSSNYNTVQLESNGGMGAINVLEFA